MSKDIIRDLWAGNFVNWVELGAQGTARGVFIMWDNRVLSKVDEGIGVFSTSCVFKNIDDGFQWIFIGVYGPNDDNLRVSCWLELKDFYAKWALPWCVAGDFNVVRFPNEKKGGDHLSLAMRLFLDFVESNELIGPPIIGGWFTWSSNRDIPSLSRLDRFLFSPL
ncbi:hypothetical protein L1049_027993 [Liquidambar formosana]|uniref:Endonuclease/exonuclease/phosphatase domain-containing protein n=1 Tax=Liquidambar formosana TaxID=63359 RepID=A0AAP0RJP7_LIQFO